MSTETLKPTTDIENPDVNDTAITNTDVGTGELDMDDLEKVAGGTKGGKG